MHGYFCRSASSCHHATLDAYERCDSLAEWIQTAFSGLDQGICPRRNMIPRPPYSLLIDLPYAETHPEMIDFAIFRILRQAVDTHNVGQLLSAGFRSPGPRKSSRISACSLNITRSVWIPMRASPRHLVKSSGFLLSPCASCAFSQ